MVLLPLFRARVLYYTNEDLSRTKLTNRRFFYVTHTHFEHFRDKIIPQSYRFRLRSGAKLQNRGQIEQFSTCRTRYFVVEYA